MKKGSILFLAMIVMILVAGCSRKKEVVRYHSFAKQTWNRFDVLKFDIPVGKDGNYNVLLEASLTPDFEKEIFAINMLMVTPSGEERINEYSQRVKRQGKFIGQCNSDSCVLIIRLKEGLNLTKGTLKLEIENLIPYIETTGLLGIKIRIVPCR